MKLSASNVCQRRHGLLVFATLQSFLLGGVIFGWASMYMAMLREGIYFNVCDPSDVQDSEENALHMWSTPTSVTASDSVLPSTTSTEHVDVEKVSEGGSVDGDDQHMIEAWGLPVTLVRRGRTHTEPQSHTDSHGPHDAVTDTTDSDHVGDAGGLSLGGPNTSESFQVEKPKTCLKQILKLKEIYTVASAVSLTSSILLGPVLDSYGPRFCICLSAAISAVGFFLAGISEVYSFDGYLAGFVMIGFAAPGILSSLMHVANLYPKNTGTATLVINGGFQLSFAIFLAFQHLNLYDHHIFSLSNLFVGYGTMVMCTVVVSILVWPDRPFPVGASGHLKRSDGVMSFSMPDGPPLLDDKSHAGAPTLSLPVSGGVAGSGDELNTDSTESTTFKDGVPRSPAPTPRHHVNRYPPFGCCTMKQQLTSMPFILLNLYAIVNILWSNFYIGSISDRLASLTSNHDIVHTYTTIFNAMLPLGVVALPLGGWVIDKYDIPVMLDLTSALGVLYSVCIVVPGLATEVPAYVIYSTYRTFLFSALLSALSRYFGFQYYGIISGVLFAVSGCFNFSQYLLNEFVFNMCDGSFETLNIIQLCTIIAATCIGFALRKCV
eukprot:GFYU01004530.1.p1 GENE.GFYU01004530.1~~GFYU01004530.1.p1  ORF type:complete len:605 (+),score=154.78 GFYU01004530.1:242-2056(+)